MPQSASQLSHVAVLLPSVRAAATKLAPFPAGEPESWEGEGTLEIYVGDAELRGRLLLMEPEKEGAYSRALAKRGPGLHHIAVEVLDLEAYLSGLAGSGWFLHLNSLHTIRKARTAYLARPGFPGLIEVQEKKELSTARSFIEKLEIPLTPERQRMIYALRTDGIAASPDGECWIQAEGRRLQIRDLW